MTECDSCGWVGEDCEPVPCSDGELQLCMSCRFALVITQEAKTVGKMTPAMLVPLIRSCVSQSVGTIVANVLQQLSESAGSQEFDKIVEALKAGGTPLDPN